MGSRLEHLDKTTRMVSLSRYLASRWNSSRELFMGTERRVLKRFSDHEMKAHADYLADCGQMNASSMIKQLLKNKEVALAALRHCLIEHPTSKLTDRALEEIIIGEVDEG